MALIVMKFGGTSVADPDRIRRAAGRAVARHRAGDRVVMVVSARGKRTDDLVRLADELTDDPDPREMDVLLATGEQESIALTAMAVRSLGVPAVSFTGGQLGIGTDSAHTRARIRQINTARLTAALDAGRVVVAAGFQGVDPGANVTTLGRGGSDLTATALAAVLDADLCEIYTDVPGVLTTDPRVEPSARRLARISYDEMLELASLGAGVMHSRSVEFAKKYDVPIHVRHSQTDEPGTLITRPGPRREGTPDVAGVALVRDAARVTLADLPDEPGVMGEIFRRMADRAIPIDMVVQDAAVPDERGGGRAEVSFTVPEEDLAAALAAANAAVQALGRGRVASGVDVSKVSAVGLGMRDHAGVAAKLFRVLADAGINIELVTTSEIKVSCLVARGRAKEAVRAVHAGFGLDRLPEKPAAEPDPPDAAHPLSEADRRVRSVVGGLAAMEDIVVSDVRLDADQARITVRPVPDEPGVLAGLFAAVAEAGISVDMIVQNVSHDGRAGISFTVPTAAAGRTAAAVRTAAAGWPGRPGGGGRLGRQARRERRGSAEPHRRGPEAVHRPGRGGRERAAHQHQRGPRQRRDGRRARRRRRAGRGPGVRARGFVTVRRGRLQPSPRATCGIAALAVTLR